ncbi:hypothetical protein [Nonomuraea recticatena]|uniref:hypothetical protein n=1 Tax=Nonomuraea recticatena TaxID=46178 RepID=UPI00360A7068
MREQLVREAMAAAGVDALVLRPSPDHRFLGGTGESFLVVLQGRPPVETSDPASLVPRGRAGSAWTTRCASPSCSRCGSTPS